MLFEHDNVNALARKEKAQHYAGDTIHPSTLEIMYELGILDEFLKRPHQQVTELGGKVGSETVTIADFTHLPTHCHFLALMPQWDFLNFITEQASRCPTFHLRMQAEVTDLIEVNGTVGGVRAKTPHGTLEIRASLTVGADGRRSVVRERAGLKVIDLGAPMDVMWMRLSRRPTDPPQTLGHFDRGRILFLINREDYWLGAHTSDCRFQAADLRTPESLICAFVIPKGTADEIRQRGLEAFRQEIAALEPFLQDRIAELGDWKQISLLTVTVDRLARWYQPGLLCIGDAAHAMSPIGGVGINLAIQDAVAAANLLGPKLRQNNVTESDLEAVQRRRSFPTRATQRFQILIQNNVIRKILGSDKTLSAPWVLKLLQRWPVLRRIPARVLGLGFRPEHVKAR